MKLTLTALAFALVFAPPVTVRADAPCSPFVDVVGDQRGSDQYAAQDYGAAYVTLQAGAEYHLGCSRETSGETRANHLVMGSTEFALMSAAIKRAGLADYSDEWASRAREAIQQAHGMAHEGLKIPDLDANVRKQLQQAFSLTANP
jgi:hypothetical protein